jgi:hypothetical protein
MLASFERSPHIGDRALHIGASRVSICVTGKYMRNYYFWLSRGVPLLGVPRVIHFFHIPRWIAFLVRKIKENNKNFEKNKILWDVVMLRDLVVRKNNKLEFSHILQKKTLCQENDNNFCRWHRIEKFFIWKNYLNEKLHPNLMAYSHLGFF